MSSFFKVVLPLLLLVNVAVAQDEELYSYGTVISTSPTQITIEQYDIETDAQVNESFMIDANTKYEEGTTLKDIKTGDQVDIYYMEKDGKKIASDIITFSQEDFEYEEEETTPQPAQ